MNSFTITVLLTDDSVEKRTSRASIIVTVTDANEIPSFDELVLPRFSENSPEGTSDIGVISASDPDCPNGRCLKFSLKPLDGVETELPFSIDDEWL